MEPKIIYETPCCKSEYYKENNDGWMQYVCKTCGNKTEPKKVGIKNINWTKNKKK
jgi:hypothetical protein